MLPLSSSEPTLQKLRGFSPAAMRMIAARPGLVRFLERPPRFERLERLRDIDAERAGRLLRLMRARVFVHTAAREAEGASPLETGRLWARFADVALRVADRTVYREVTARLGRPLGDDGREVPRAIFALGKLGSEELNPSSDIDVLFVYGTDQGSAGNLSLHELFVRWAQRVRDLVARPTELGFVFRVDLDLRPEGTTGPLVNSVDALESYYERFGMTWERAALVRLRPVVDTGGLSELVQRRLRPFVFPRVHDLKAIDELARMKHRVTLAATTDGFDVKRGEGGIREVEFVAQALQLLHGGRMPELRKGSIVTVLRLLEEKGLLSHRMARELTESYVLLRRLEHALQYEGDRQTQTLPREGPLRDRVARALLQASPAVFAETSFDEEIERRRAEVHRVFEAMLGKERDVASADARLALQRKADDKERTAALARMGFSHPEEALRLLRVLERQRNSPFSPQARAQAAPFAGLAAKLLDEAAESPDPMAALSRLPDLFCGFVHRSLLERLRDDPRLSSLLMRVLAVSGPLSRLLSRQVGLEAVLLHDRFEQRLSRAALLRELRADLDPDDEEARLVRMRRVHGRVVLGVGLGFFGGRLDVITAGHRLSTLADAILEDALDLARRKVARRFGEPEGARFGVFALGRLGGRELGFFADVDLVFVYDARGSTAGQRSISAGEWASRVAQQLIWALSAPLVEGRAYEVDARLRPSGNAGPLCTHVEAFARYHEQESALWERQALLRLRSVVCDPELREATRAAVQRALLRPPPEGLGMELLDMRARIVKERAAREGGTLDIKLGEGGLSEVEFAVQGLLLAHAHDHPEILTPSMRRALVRLVRAGLLDEATATALRQGYDRLSALREALVLVDDQKKGAVFRHDPRLSLLARAHPVTRELARAEDAADGPQVFDGLLAEAARIRELAHRVLLRI